MSTDRPLRALYICYLPTTDPLVETQVVAYLRGLAAAGHQIHLLSFEVAPRDPQREAEREARFAACGIFWERLTYHKCPTLLATIYDVLRGVLRGFTLIRRHRIELVHARVHVPAAMGLLLARLTGCRLIFDIRGLIAEESVETGRWREGGIPERLTKWVERRTIAREDGAVVLTKAARTLLFGDEPAQPIHVIPCCVDLDRFEGSNSDKSAARSELGLSNEVVMAYVGKFTGWYMEAEMVNFFAAAGQEIKDLHFLIFTQSDPDLIVAQFQRHRAPPDSYMVTQVEPDRLGELLVAADFGISFIRPTFSKLASSPTKLGEYLAAGLPVLATRGVGGVDEIIRDGEGVGVFVDEHSPRAYQSAAREMLSLAQESDVRARCAAVARTELSLQVRGIPEYLSLYDAVGKARLGR